MGGNIRKRTLRPSSGAAPEVQDHVCASFSLRVARPKGGDGGEGFDVEADGPVLQRKERVWYKIGEGEAVPVLELALRHMRVGEELEAYGISRFAWGPDGLPAIREGDADLPGDADVLLTVELHEIKAETASVAEARLFEAGWRKRNGNDYYRHRDLRRAARAFAAALKLFTEPLPDDAIPEELRERYGAEATQLLVDCGSNLAAVQVALKNWPAARDAAVGVLEVDPSHVKALYRAGTAAMHLHDFAGATLAVKTALAADPDNAAVRRLARDLKARKAEYAEKKKAMGKRLGRDMLSIDSSSEAAAAPAATEAGAGGEGGGGAAAEADAVGDGPAADEGEVAAAEPAKAAPSVEDERAALGMYTLVGVALVATIAAFLYCHFGLDGGGGGGGGGAAEDYLASMRTMNQ